MTAERGKSLARVCFKVIALFLEDDLERFGEITRECMEHCEGDEDGRDLGETEAERDFVRAKIREAISAVAALEVQT